MRLMLMLILGLCVGCSGSVDLGSEDGDTTNIDDAVQASQPEEENDIAPVSTLVMRGQFSDISREIVLSAYEEWLSFGAEFGAVIVESVDEPMPNADGTGKHWAWYSSSQHTIYIARPDRDAYKLYASALHEFGHAAGLQHHHSGFGVLGDVEWSTEMPSCISSDDLTALGLEVAGDFCVSQ
jgi:hypothetical protein